ncbi:hypothetical protein [Streptomyces sp. TLI_146]|uniref:hypothetical protein n=1 Tax=Streptomyces sp. TLI_146 TaxID=1938858 RepID=UPI000C710D0F|nr:hypothetical protein [Streptomyces sp. TLI_146]PKV90019.1 hypothetical protein BX283_7677 [Streptomyces sp. TLI_146]
MTHHTPSGHTPSGKDDKGGPTGEQDTALDEVFREIEEAATRPENPERREHGHRGRDEDGEARDALTPNTEAQKRSGS